MTILEKVLLAQVAVQTPAVVYLCFRHGPIIEAIRQLQLKVFYKVEDKRD
jgi:hypothetical protein